MHTHTNALTYVYVDNNKVVSNTFESKPRNCMGGVGGKKEKGEVM